MNLPPMQGITVTSGEWDWRYNWIDDLKSLRRYLQRILSPSATGGGEPVANEPYFYLVPDVDDDDVTEGEFRRPAITIQLVEPEGVPVDTVPLVSRPSYEVEHSVVIRVHGVTRTSTLRLAERALRAIVEGGPDGAAYRPQMWAFDLGAMLARRMRVVRTSVEMGIETTDDEGKWSCPIRMRVRVPRIKTVHARPVVEQING